MEKIKIIGISGKIGSGKDTFAEELASFISPTRTLLSQETLHIKKVERYAFADKLREMVQLLTGYKMTEIEDTPFWNKIYNYTQEQKNVHLPLWDKTVGECLQVMGTESIRENFDYDVWIKSLFATSGKECMKRGHIMVIPDVRFPNEADYILEQGGIVIRMEGDPVNVRETSTRNLNHISETALDDYENFSRIIENFEPSIELLRDEITKVINDFNVG